METEVQYIGEHIWPGVIGHICVILSFTSILFSVYTYYRSQKSTEQAKSWLNMGRFGFAIHSVSVLGLISMLFYVMINKMYEYSYVFEHVSEDLPMQYIFSAFWEGQEGSFLLWMFWHIVLGIVLIFKAGKWEAPVMMFVALVQSVIASMLLGVHLGIGDMVYKLGSNPTLLLRDVIDAPIFTTADYLASIQGSGLNPLLQNYWMTIHPPTLFLGFASVTIPFAYAAAGFYTKDYNGWLAPCLKWSLFSAGILGVGILMGGAWAYEALTFGGYWAWDPVENMSLVPWLILVAAVHTNLIAKSTGRAIKSSFVYYALSFVLILYSTYLTRSGILGDTSVHAFTEMGLEPQLIFLVLFFAIISTVLFFRNAKYVPIKEKEESIYSREFWMFVGALILLFSGIIITTSTSLPVFNTIMTYFDPDFSGKVIQDEIQHYNKFQIWIAVLISVLTGKVIHMRYKSEEWSDKKIKTFAKQNIIFFALAGLIVFLITLWIDLLNWKYIVLSLAAVFTVVSNGSYLLKNLKGNIKMAGSVFSHVGFGIMLIGILASGLNESVITTNPFAMKGLIKDEDLGNSVTLIKGVPFYVNEYWITYEKDTIEDYTRTFHIKFQREDSTGLTADSFYVYPNLLFSNDLTKVAAFNPGTKRGVQKDIFTRIASLPKSQIDVEFAKAQEDSLKYVSYTLGIGDTIFTAENYAILEYISFDPKHKEYLAHQSDMGLALGIRFYNLDKSYEKLIEPALGLNDNLLYQYAEKIEELGVKIKLNDQSFNNFFTEENELEYQTFRIKQGESFEFGNLNFTLSGFQNQIDHENYTFQEGDISIQANLVVTGNSTQDTLQPLYIIRDNKPMSIKDYEIQNGVHIRLSHINPVEEEFTFALALDKRDSNEFVVDIAEKIPRSDIINLEAKIFPGINLFWLGSCMMLAGFFIAYWNRYRSKYA